MLLTSIKRILKNSAICATVISTVVFSTTISSQAAAYTVTPETGVLLSCVGTEVFSDANPGTYVTTVKANTPVNVIGRTSNGFWQVDVNGTPYYISQQALSTMPNKTAYRLTSFDAGAVLVANASNGKLIYSQGAMDKLEPASTTKIMTALLTVEAIEAGKISLETPVMVSNSALAALPSDASHVSPRLSPGEIMNVDQLLTAMMVSSDCHASNVLAELVAGSVPNFVAMMNARAAQLGCVNTNFTNPSGYPDVNMYTNAYSLYIITLNAISHPLFNQYFGKTTAVLPATNTCPTPRVIANTDSLMDVNSVYYNPNVIGGKTGSANRAGQCLVSVASSNGKTVISVVLGAKTRTMFDGNRVAMRYAESNRLINLGFENY